MSNQEKNFDFLLEILIKEIEIIEEKVNHFDKLIHSTRQIGILIWVSILSFASTTDNEIALLISVFIPLPFWITEATYKRYSQGWQERRNALQIFLSSQEYHVLGKFRVTITDCFEKMSFSGLPILDYFGNNTINPKIHKERTSFVKNFLRNNVVRFYLPLILISLLFVCWNFNKKTRDNESKGHLELTGGSMDDLLE